MIEYDDSIGATEHVWPKSTSEGCLALLGTLGAAEHSAIPVRLDLASVAPPLHT